MKYRSEIDGLRAVAVIPVIIFHSGLGLAGGFAGVDVFFVISGYLITAIIYEEVRRGRFSILRFYERRIRRIAPALLCVCLACLPFAWAWMLPYELREFGRSLYHVNLFISNFAFWSRVGYFDTSNDLKPLLHTWSLGVEEQFYLIFPLVLMVLRRFQQMTALVLILALSLVSFALTQVVSQFDPAANFYLLPTRFWELGFGAALSLVAPGGRAVRHGGLLAGAGLVLIGMSYLWVGQASVYPGWATLPVVLGTMLVLAFASPANLAGRLLSLRPVVFIGALSYSLYLWHQPVLAFARMRLFTIDLDVLTCLSLIGLTFLLATASYYLVEQPFRDRTKTSARLLVSAVGVIGVASIAVGITFEATRGVTSRAPSLPEMTEVSVGLGKVCNGRTAPECWTDRAPELAVWGDSFAAHLVQGIVASAPDVKLVQLTKSACGPILDTAYQTPLENQKPPESCLDRNADVLKTIGDIKTLHYVAIGINLDPYGSSRYLFVRDKGLIPPDPDLTLSNFLLTLSRLRALGLSPVVFAPPPQTGEDTGACVARSKLLGIDAAHCDLQAERVRQTDAFAHDLLDAVAKQYPVIDMAASRCDDKTCRVSDGGVSLYADMGHFSQAGIKLLGLKNDLYHLIVKAATQGCGITGPGGLPAGICRPS